MHLGRAFERFWLSAETASHRSGFVQVGFSEVILPCIAQPISCLCADEATV